MRNQEKNMMRKELLLIIKRIVKVLKVQVRAAVRKNINLNLVPEVKKKLWQI